MDGQCLSRKVHGKCRTKGGPMFAEILRENVYGAYRVRLEALIQIPTDASDRDIHELIGAGFSAGNVKVLCDFGRMSPLERYQIISPKALKTRLALGQR